MDWILISRMWKNWYRIMNVSVNSLEANEVEENWIIERKVN